MKVQKDSTSTHFDVKFSSSRSGFTPSIKSTSRNFNTRIDTNKGEELYDEIIIYDGGDVDGYGYEEEES